MNDRTSHARQWLAKATSDLTAAQRLLDADGPFDAVRFHAQQAALCLALPASGGASGLEGLDLSGLTPFAVESRYDNEFWPERGEAEDAVALAARVCAAVGSIVGA